MIQRLGVDIKKAKCLLGTSRPTAVNLAWALDKVVKLINFTITPIFPPTIFSIANNCTIDIRDGRPAPRGGGGSPPRSALWGGGGSTPRPAP